MIDNSVFEIENFFKYIDKFEKVKKLFCDRQFSFSKSNYKWFVDEKIIPFLNSQKIFIVIIPYLTQSSKSLKEIFVFKGKIFNFNRKTSKIDYEEYMTEIFFHDELNCKEYCVKLCLEKLEDFLNEKENSNLS